MTKPSVAVGTNSLRIPLGSTSAQGTGRTLAQWGIASGATTQRVVIALSENVLVPVYERLAVLERQATSLATAPSGLVAMVTLNTAGLRLRAPIFVEVGKGESSFSASSTEFECYGVGESGEDALDDFRRVFVDDYEFLRENEADLGAHPARMFLRFQEVIEDIR